MKKHLDRLLDKVPILKYIIKSLVKWFAIIALFFAAIYVALSLTGKYAVLESRLDLKYNSPLVLLPMQLFAAAAVLSFVIGFLLYFHRYKRSKTKSKFHEAVAPILDHTRTKK